MNVRLCVCCCLLLPSLASSAQQLSLKGRITHLPNHLLEFRYLGELVKIKTTPRGDFSWSGSAPEKGLATLTWNANSTETRNIKGMAFLVSDQEITIQVDSALTARPLVTYARQDLSKPWEDYQAFENRYIKAFQQAEANVLEAKEASQQEAVINELVIRRTTLIDSYLDSLRSQLVSGRYAPLETFLVEYATGLIGWRNQPEFFEGLLKQIPLQGEFYPRRVRRYLDGHSKVKLGSRVDTLRFANHATGRVQPLKELQPRFVLIEFWASWCGPCIKLIPEFKRVHAAHSDQVEIVSVSIDKDRSQWLKALEKQKMPWIQVLDSQNKSRWAEAFFVDGVPDNLLISPTGEIVGRDVTIGDLLSRMGVK